MLVACRLVSSHLYLSTFVIFRQTGYQLYSYRQKSQRILFRRLPSLREEIAASSDKYVVYHTNITMGVVKETITAGDGKNFPKKGDKLTMHYL
jgi:hypothetical protein